MDRTQSIDLRQRYLEKAADLLFAQNLKMSAHLQRVKAELPDQTLSLEGCCPGCGLKLLPGWSCEQVRKGRKSRRDIRRIARSDAVDTQVECVVCRQRSHIKKSKRGRPRPSTTQSESEPMSDVITTDTATEPVPSLPKPANVSLTASRKSRSKKASLQGLLAKQKEQIPTQTSYGLGFADLLKK